MTFARIKRFCILFALCSPFLTQPKVCSGSTSLHKHFIVAKGDKLYDGENEFRFISYNIPNLHYVEDNMVFEETIPFRLPDEFEIRDALLSIKQSGGRVVRIYTLSVRRPDDPPEMPRHVLGPGQFNEEAFVALDKCLQIANEYGIRLIIPFVDNWKWWGGRGDYAAFRGKDTNAFWSDPQIIKDFKKTISFVINRVNTQTGVAYRNDKAILAWETGNELTSPPEWTGEIAAFIKSLDPNHLIIDGKHSSTLHPESLADPNIDLVTTHHYQKKASEIISLVLQNAKKASGKKPYFVGEFGFIDTRGVSEVLDAVINSSCSGALIWSLRSHNRDGGFYWHSEPYGGNLFKSYHWPGFASGEAFDETRCVQLLQEKAYEIRRMQPPELSLPAPPELLPIDEVAKISWQGSTGAASYRIERAEKQDGPWTTIADRVSDAEVQYRPLFNDKHAEKGKTYFYRIFAQNKAGESAPSNIVAAAPVKHLTLIDECRDWSQTAGIIGAPFIVRDNARQTKEDAHRFAGKEGDGIIYHFEQPVASFKAYVFFPNKVADFVISGSGDGESFIPLPFQRFDYYTGKGEYDYYKPVLFASSSTPDGITSIKFEFSTQAEISRIEVEYAQ